jgi:photosystem II stability/assembly factor-like uncharacterized protein
MSWRSSGKIALIGVLAAILGSGCGSLSHLTGGSHRSRPGIGEQLSSQVAGHKKKPKRPNDRAGRSGDPRRGRAPGKSLPRQVGSFTGFFDRRTGRLTISTETVAMPSGGTGSQGTRARHRSEGVGGPASGRAGGEVRTRATGYGPVHALTMTGSAPAPVGGVMSGNVTLTSNNPVELIDVRAVLTSISDSSVTANNPNGTTNLTGTPRPYWDFDDLTVTRRSSTKLWRFNNPGGVSFTFRIVVYANTFTFTSADGNAFRASSFVNASTGWAVGGGGKLFKTTDGGATWTPQNTGTGEDLKDVSFISPSLGWAVGNTGTLIATSDGGLTWRHLRVTYTDPTFGPTTFFGALFGVKFLTAAKGFAVGEDQMIFCTTDGGNTWSLKSSSDTGGTLFDICFANSSTGWAVGDQATIMKTNDGGNTWFKQTIPVSERFSGSDTSNILQAVASPDGNRVCAVGIGGWVVVSSNGGATWTRRNKSPSVTPSLLNSVYFPTASIGWAAGQSGALIKTTDGGTTWSLVSPFPVGSHLFGVTGLPGNSNLLWIAADSGILVYTTNGGTTWLRPGDLAGGRWAVATSNVNALWFVDNQHGWAAGDKGMMLRTTDGGASWRVPSGSLVGSDYRDVHFINANEGWAVGTGGRILHTTNGGQNWVDQDWFGQELEVPPALNGVRFLDALNGWIVGGSSTILKTTDGGENWEAVPPPVSGGFNKIHWLDANRGWIIGSSGIVLATTDGGLNWDQTFSGTTRSLNGIDVVAGPTGVSGWIVGDQHTLLHSTDGFDWQPVDLSSFGSLVKLSGVDFLPDGKLGWVVGDSGFLLRTRDGGASWELVNPGDSAPLQAVRLLDADEIWIGGRGGTLKVFR